MRTFLARQRQSVDPMMKQSPMLRLLTAGSEAEAGHLRRSNQRLR